ncbi:hypothetical protein BH10ACT3_BH10ACT3_12030 [soil metagenome]
MKKTTRPRRVRRVASAVLVASAGTLLWCGTASAHITPQDPDAPSGAYFTTAFKVAHGCDGSPTTRIEIKMAEGVTSVKPQPVAGWTLSTTMRELDPPIDNHGTAITESVDTVVWEGGSLPDDQLQMFWVSMKLPEGEPGTALAFPVVQTCAEGSTDWIDPVVEGQAEPEHPAPSVTLTSAEGEGHDAADAVDEVAQDGDAAPDEDALQDATGAGTDLAADDDSSNGLALGLGIGGLVLGAAGLVTGGVALSRSNRRGDAA